MIEILVNNVSLDLSLDLELSLEFESSLFDLDTTSKIFSFPFKLPATAKNKNALKFPFPVGSQSAPALPAKLTIGGLFLSGEFVFTKILDNYYEGFFKSGVGLMKQYGGRFLGDFLDFTLGFAGQNTLDFYNNTITQYLAKGGPVCFPETLFPLNQAENGTFRSNYLRPENGAFMLNTDVADPLLLPCIQLSYALKTFFGAAGYDLTNYASTYFPQFLDVYFFNNKKPYKGRNTRIRTPPNQNTLLYPMRLGDYCPAITIKDFFDGLRKTFGLWIFVDDITKTAKIFFQKDLVLKSANVDWTRKINPDYQKSPEPTPPLFGFQFSNGIDDNDWVKLPPINASQNIPQLLDNEIVFVIERNLYLRRQELNPFYPNYRAYVPFSYGENNLVKTGQTETVVSPFGAGRKVESLLIEADCRVGKTGNKVVLTTNFISPITLGSVFVLDPQSAWEGAKGILNLVNNVITIDYNFNQSPFAIGDYIKCRFLFPLTAYGNLLDYTQEGDNLLFLYHGLQARPPGGIAGQRTYGSPDSYGPSNNALPGPLFALRWQFADGLYNTLWKDYEAYLKRGSISTKAALDAIEAQKVAQDISPKIYAQGSGFLIDKISLKATKDGFGISDITIR